MGLAKWLRPPGRTLTVFLCLMLVLGGTLSWFGWRLLEQDRALEKQRLQERLELAADGVSAALQQSLANLESYLSFIPGPGAEKPPDGALVLQVTKRAVNVFPPASLLYYPVIPDGEEPPDTTFAAGETLEFRRNDPARAAEVFRELARSPDRGVRAGALLRLGRNLRKIGRFEESLRVFGELAQLGQTPVFGLPAELTASEARCTVLETIGKREELRQEASLMRSALWSGRWSLLRPAWEFHVEEAQRWSGESALQEREQNAFTLSAAVESICGQWMAQPESKGNRILEIDDQPVFFSWEGTSDRLAAVLAGPTYLNKAWTETARSRSVQAALIDTEGQVMIGSFTPSGPRAVRTSAATKLPGTLQISLSGAGAGEEGASGRRSLHCVSFRRCCPREGFQRKACGRNLMTFCPARASGCRGSSSRCWISAASKRAHIAIIMRTSIP